MNTSTSDSFRNAAPAVVRIGIALVFLWFGTQQLLDASAWTRLIPEWIVHMSGLSAVSLVHFNGAFETIFGLALLVGYQTRIVALLLALHLAGITLDVGYNGVGVRDFGLTLAAVAIFLYGSDMLSLDNKLRKGDTQS